ncbi:MAG: hypothetical protein Q9174_006227 [Haloplaca sp. 1 TL-2023]
MSIPTHHRVKQASLTPSRSHLSVNSLSTTIPSRSNDPRDDDFDYEDQGPSQTPSKERDGKPASGTALKVLGNAVSFDELDEKLYASPFVEYPMFLGKLRWSKTNGQPGDIGQLLSDPLPTTYKESWC